MTSFALGGAWPHPLAAKNRRQASAAKCRRRKRQTGWGRLRRFANQVGTAGQDDGAVEGGNEQWVPILFDPSDKGFSRFSQEF